MSGAMKSTKKTCRPSSKNISSCTAIFEFDEIDGRDEVREVRPGCGCCACWNESPPIWMITG
jgi:hypothetical protein